MCDYDKQGAWYTTHGNDARGRVRVCAGDNGDVDENTTKKSFAAATRRPWMPSTPQSRKTMWPELTKIGPKMAELCQSRHVQMHESAETAHRHTDTLAQNQQIKEQRL